MKRNAYALLIALLLFSRAPASAQTDALVVDDTGRVGVVLIGQDEALQVTASLEPNFLDLPRRCQLGVPIRILISDAQSGLIRVDEQKVLSGASRILAAEFPATYDGNNSTLQVAVATTARLRICVTSGISAISENGIRRIEPDRLADQAGDIIVQVLENP